MSNPLCPNDCDQPLQEVEFDECAPEINLSEIKRLFIGKKNTPAFNNWAQAQEWTERISPTANEATSLRELTVIGDKPAPSNVQKNISNARIIQVGKDHTINFSVDDVSDKNYDFARATECGTKVRIWYETMGGKMYGGNKGILAYLVMDLVLARGTEEIEAINGVVTWRAKFSPERVDSPIFVSDND